MNSSSLTVARTLKPVAIVFLWAVILLSIGVIIQFGLLARPTMAVLTHRLQLPDFLMHVVAFACLSLPAFLLFRPMIKAAFGVFIIGVWLELAQWLTRLGEVSLVDLIANATGIALAGLAVILLKRCDFAILRPLLGNPS